MTTDLSRVKRLDPRILLVTALSAVVALTTTTVGAATAAPARTAALTAARKVEPLTFTLSSFNVLGSTHTTSGSRLASGVERIGLAVKLLDRTGTDVVGFQELQLDQFDAFYALAGTRYGIYPGGVDRRTVQNSIAWNLTSWRFVSGTTVAIPYFDGVEWQMPVVLLQSVQTGQLAYFANFHNPATNKRHPGQDQWRAEAARREVRLAKSLYWETGLPVFVTGDMNDREKYFCPMAGGAPMKAANGGKFDKKTGVCTPPPKPMPVDWIFGPKGRATFSNYVRDDSALVQKITDHYVIRADVTLPAPPAFVPPPTQPTTPTP